MFANKKMYGVRICFNCYFSFCRYVPSLISICCFFKSMKSAMVTSLFHIIRWQHKTRSEYCCNFLRQRFSRWFGFTTWGRCIISLKNEIDRTKQITISDIFAAAKIMHSPLFKSLSRCDDLIASSSMSPSLATSSSSSNNEFEYECVVFSLAHSFWLFNDASDSLKLSNDFSSASLWLSAESDSLSFDEVSSCSSGEFLLVSFTFKSMPNIDGVSFIFSISSRSGDANKLLEFSSSLDDWSSNTEIMHLHQNSEAMVRKMDMSNDTYVAVFLRWVDKTLWRWCCSAQNLELWWEARREKIAFYRIQIFIFRIKIEMHHEPVNSQEANQGRHDKQKISLTQFAIFKRSSIVS